RSAGLLWAQSSQAVGMKKMIHGFPSGFGPLGFEVCTRRLRRWSLQSQPFRLHIFCLRCLPRAAPEYRLALGSELPGRWPEENSGLPGSWPEENNTRGFCLAFGPEELFAPFSDITLRTLRFRTSDLRFRMCFFGICDFPSCS